MSQLAFHNTNQESGATLQTSQEQARRQEAVILNVFGTAPLVGFTPAQASTILRDYFDYYWPITSVRRAITNLTKQGLLEKTGIQRMGPYGKRNYVWRVICLRKKLQ